MQDIKYDGGRNRYRLIESNTDELGWIQTGSKDKNKGIHKNITLE
jgi:hypothetical protein